MNEILFFAHTCVILFFILRLGKEALFVFISLFAVLANFFVIKQIDLFGLHAACGDVFAVGSILCLNILQEKFGKREADKAIMISFLSLFFFFLMTKFHLLYKPNSFDFAHASFSTLFNHSFRIILASIAAFFISQKTSLLVFQLMKKQTVRIPIALFVSQVVDSILFGYLGLFGIVESVWAIIFISLIVKIVVILLSSFFVQLSKSYV